MTYSFSPEQWEYLFRLGYPGTWDKASLASEAIYRGGEAIVKGKLLKNQYLPFNIEDIIEEGMKNLSKDLIHLQTAAEVEQQLNQALKEKKGFSVIRLGDGEILALAHDILVSSEEINSNRRLKGMGGFKVPNHEKRDLLVKNLLEADIVGLPEARYPVYQRMFNQVAKAYTLPLHTMKLTTSLINYQLNQETTFFHNILGNYKVLLIGNRSVDGKDFFIKKGYSSISGTIMVPGFDSIEKVMEEVDQYEFDIAFVSAGVAANIICVEIAKRNKPAIDFGHLLDWYLSGRRVIRTQ
ncbi:GT-D fold domain-containing glycosyltransferase [Neobacillus sp. PS2-9]|uniref:GT-D fold domain-containing protein n=1 Tax=Neobacillus sp. PS2-9 TaxID=3070676 RepID=UPI0027E0FB25|nr:GT-D fold domain-containing glycosyltransferase [Neobacillus sp. PS2-9]WML58027.1 GT-D fold domain-containing glycosyltransferase [Neobacillus sp. PS2-9]